MTCAVTRTTTDAKLKMRRRQPPASSTTHRPPAMSGFGMDDDVERSRQAGFAEHLTKPIEFAALHQAIPRLVQQRSDPRDQTVL